MATQNPPQPGSDDSNPPPMSRVQRFNIVGTFPNQVKAREALVALRSRGLAEADTKLLGEEQDMVPRPSGLPEADLQVAKGVLSTTVLAAIAGAVIGGIIAIIIVLIGPFRSGLSLHMSAGTIIGAAVIGIIIGGIIGGLVGLFGGVDSKVTGEDSYGDQVTVGPAQVGVHAETAAQISAASEALRACSALDVQTVTPMQHGDG